MKIINKKDKDFLFSINKQLFFKAKNKIMDDLFEDDQVGISKTDKATIINLDDSDSDSDDDKREREREEREEREREEREEKEERERKKKREREKEERERERKKKREREKEEREREREREEKIEEREESERKKKKEKEEKLEKEKLEKEKLEKEKLEKENLEKMNNTKFNINDFNKKSPEEILKIVNEYIQKNCNTAKSGDNKEVKKYCRYTANDIKKITSNTFPDITKLDNQKLNVINNKLKHGEDNIPFNIETLEENLAELKFSKNESESNLNKYKDVDYIKIKNILMESESICKEIDNMQVDVIKIDKDIELGENNLKNKKEEKKKLDSIYKMDRKNFDISLISDLNQNKDELIKNININSDIIRENLNKINNQIQQDELQLQNYKNTYNTLSYQVDHSSNVDDFNKNSLFNYLPRDLQPLSSPLYDNDLFFAIIEVLDSWYMYYVHHIDGFFDKATIQKNVVKNSLGEYYFDKFENYVNEKKDNKWYIIYFYEFIVKTFIEEEKNKINESIDNEKDRIGSMKNVTLKNRTNKTKFYEKSFRKMFKFVNETIPEYSISFKNETFFNRNFLMDYVFGISYFSQINGSVSVAIGGNLINLSYINTQYIFTYIPNKKIYYIKLKNQNLYIGFNTMQVLAALQDVEKFCKCKLSSSIDEFYIYDFDKNEHVKSNWK